MKQIITFSCYALSLLLCFTKGYSNDLENDGSLSINESYCIIDDCSPADIAVPQEPLLVMESPVFPYASCPPCYNFWSRFYVGLDGGWATGFSTSKRDLGGGPLASTSSSISYGLSIQAGYNVGANIGFILCPCLRTDFSYTFLSNPVKWQNQSSGGAAFSLNAQLHSHLLLWNAYLHLNDFSSCCSFSPYLTGGIGFAINDLGKVSERNASSVLTSNDQGHSHTNFGARFGLGLLKPFRSTWVLDMGTFINYIGTVESGNRQTPLAGGSSIPIQPYRHIDNWIGTFYVGVKRRI
jgi:opacity protein-like surface antigen